jgi:uncharacterized protein
VPSTKLRREIFFTLAEAPPFPGRLFQIIERSGIRKQPVVLSTIVQCLSHSSAGTFLVYTELVYTKAVLDGIKGFHWDLHNVGHVARHGVNPVEVEEAVERPYVIIPAKSMGGEKRWKLFGTSAAGRCLVVVFTIRDERFRPVTAHTMNQRERRIYGPEINTTQ